MYRVVDDRLHRTSRDDLVYRLVCESLDAYRENRPSVIDLAGLSQMLRVGDDEVRVFAASAMMTYSLLSFKAEDGPEAAADSFRETLQPFLRNVWPKERSFATAHVSRNLAQLPALSGDAFVDAVDEIEPFLRPFDCHSILAYGFYDGDHAEEMKTPRLSATINDKNKARALLALLDLTIDHTQHAIFPEDLSTALERIEVVAPMLVTDPAFRRLAALARQ